MQTIPEPWQRPHLQHTDAERQSSDETGTPFDFIVVGAGAGGAPLAARLVERGFRVLVVEMGPAKPEKPANAVVENTEVPILHAETAEDPRHSLRYFVKHFDGDATTSQDPKVHLPDKSSAVEQDDCLDGGSEDEDADVPTSENPNDEAGIFYPRAQGVGGCTIHNAMVTVCGPSEDWDEIAEATGDASWKGERMRVYFERLENCLYDKPLGWIGSILKRLGAPTGWETGRHGKGGWLTTSLADLRLIKREKSFVRLIAQSAIATLSSGVEQVQQLSRAVLSGKPGHTLDPNHWETMRQSQAGLSLIPTAIDANGRRSSPREHLLRMQSRYPDRLTILSEACVTGLQYAAAPKGNTKKPKPAANHVVGVNVFPREHAYQADPNSIPVGDDWTQEVRTIYCRKEVILCGGAFNTPQLLMLSGIGPKEELDGHKIPVVSDLPGVGRNLQDRYEVPVVAKLSGRFKSLDDLRLTSLAPDAERDVELQNWIKLPKQRAADANLCSSNGGLLAILQRSKFEDSAADLFLFSLLGRFEGYSVGYSRPSQLQPGASTSTSQYAAADEKKYLTWLVLKARTKQDQGTVTLRDTNPFRRPEINFRSFPDAPDDTNLAGKDNDLEAILEGIQTVKSILDVGVAKGTIEEYELPGLAKFAGGERHWIKHVAWGHHACGTCRIGPDNDPDAVLDSRMRVRGVEGLRVVDASIFPRIYGYFIVTNIYMAAEKAADVISEDQGAPIGSGHPQAPVLPSQQEYEQRRAYPKEFEAREAAMVRARQKQAAAHPADAPADQCPWLEDLSAAKHDTSEGSEDCLPDNTIGLALSGGGIRSAAFSLGVIQSLARHDWLRHIDFLSTVSGGGYTGTFLGRFFDQCLKTTGVAGPHGDQEPGAAQDRVRSRLSDSRCTEVAWLRKHANYLSPSGLGEGLFNFATFLRNLISLQFVLAVFFLAAFGLANALGYNPWIGRQLAPLKSLVSGLTPLSSQLPSHVNSVWSAAVELTIWLAILPLMFAYWLGSQDRHRNFVYSFLAALMLLGVSGLIATRQPLCIAITAAAVGWTLESWLAINHSEGHGNPRAKWRLALGRNHITARLAFWVGVGAILFGIGLVDGTGQVLAHRLMFPTPDAVAGMTWFGSLVGLVTGLIPILNWIANLLVSRKDEKPVGIVGSLSKIPYLPTLLVLAVGAFLPLTLLSFATHAVYGLGYSYVAGVASTLVVVIVSVLLGTREALPFVNRSGPLTIYAARLARVFLGAVNPTRQRHRDGGDVSHVIEGDDVEHGDYAPHRAGGPLHLFNVAVNETVDVASQRGIRDRQAENMSVGPAGMNIAVGWHGLWTDSNPGSSLRAIDDGTTRHPLQPRSGSEVDTEPLSIRNWMGISGAAISSGTGRHTGTATSLLLTLVNMRLGYWWDSGLGTKERARTALKRSQSEKLAKIFFRFFAGQTLLLAELLGKFGGPWRKYWYLSDGGHFENSGVYELLRRRVPLIILCGAGQDRKHEATDIAELSRIARIDFGAEIQEITLETDTGKKGTTPLASQLQKLGVPKNVIPHLGSIAELLGSDTDLPAKHASLLKATFNNSDQAAWHGRDTCWILYLKATVTGDEPADVLNYKSTHPDFPNETTLDQFFDERQWESYRCLGEHIGNRVFQPKNRSN